MKCRPDAAARPHPDLYGECAAIARLSIIVLETEHPLTSGVLEARSRIALWISAMERKSQSTRRRCSRPASAGMRVGIDKPGNNRLSFKIYFLGLSGCQRLHFFVRADSEKTAVCDGDCFRARLAIVDGDDVSVVEN